MPNLVNPYIATAPYVYLLNLYGPIWLACSFRLLQPLATLSFRIRRSSDNAELDIGFVGNLADFATAQAFCGVNNGFIVTWYDQSGTLTGATQATAGLQWQIIASGQVIVNDTGFPSAFTSNNTAYYQATSSLSATQYSSFSVCEQINTANKALFSNSAANASARLNGNGTNTVSLTRNGTQGNSSVSLLVGPPGIIFASIFSPGTSSNYRINNTSSGNVTTGSAAAIGTIRLGAVSASWTGFTSEFVFYPQAASVANQNLIVTNMNNYYHCF